MIQKTTKDSDAVALTVAAGGSVTSTEVLGRVLERSERQARDLVEQRFTAVERLVTRRQEAKLAAALRTQEANGVLEGRGVEIAAALDGLRTELRALLAARSAEVSTQLTARADQLLLGLTERLAVADLDRHERDEQLLDMAAGRLRDPRRVAAFERRLDSMRTERDELLADLIRQAATDLRRLRDAYQVTGTRR